MKISTCLLACWGWGVRGRGAYFTKFLQVLSFCLEMSNGVVECKRRFVIEGKRNRCTSLKRQ